MSKNGWAGLLLVFGIVSAFIAAIGASGGLSYDHIESAGGAIGFSIISASCFIGFALLKSADEKSE